MQARICCCARCPLHVRAPAYIFIAAVCLFLYVQGKYTYREDLSAEEMARVVMENYDADFATLVKGMHPSAFPSLVCL